MFRPASELAVLLAECISATSRANNQGKCWFYVVKMLNVLSKNVFTLIVFQNDVPSYDCIFRTTWFWKYRQYEGIFVKNVIHFDIKPGPLCCDGMTA